MCTNKSSKSFKAVFLLWKSASSRWWFFNRYHLWINWPGNGSKPRPKSPMHTCKPPAVQWVAPPAKNQPRAVLSTPERLWPCGWGADFSMQHWNYVQDYRKSIFEYTRASCQSSGIPDCILKIHLDPLRQSTCVTFKGRSLDGVVLPAESIERWMKTCIL